MPEFNKKTLRNIFIIVIAGIVAYWFLHETERVKGIYQMIKGILSPFIMGAGIAFVLNVPMRAFEGLFKKIKHVKLRRVIALALTFIAFALVLAIVCLLLIPQMIITVESLIPTIKSFVSEIDGTIRQFLNEHPDLTKWIVEYTDLEKIDWPTIVQWFISLLVGSITTIVGGTFSAIGNVAGAAVDVVIALVFAIYSLFQKETLARQGRKILYSFLPEKVSDYIIHILRLSNAAFSNFLSGQCVEMCILGVLLAIAMAIFRLPYIPLICVLAAVTSFIPYVGNVIGCSVGAFLILVNNPVQALWFILLFLIIQPLENNLIYPKVVGTSVGLSGMWVLVAIAVGGELMGLAGMVLMIPAASVIHTLLHEFTNKRLGELSVDPEKLKPQPPMLRSRRKQKRKKKEEIAENKEDKTETPEENEK